MGKRIVDPAKALRRKMDVCRGCDSHSPSLRLLREGEGSGPTSVASLNHIGNLPLLLKNAALAPFHHIDGKHFVVNQAAAKLHVGIGVPKLNGKTLQQLVPYLARHVTAVGRIDVVVKDQIPKQHFPVLPHQVHESTPLEVAFGAVNNVTDIRTIKSLATRDKHFGGN